MTGSETGRIRILMIQGPTCSGKTDLAVHLAEEVGGEIVNADSMQVYAGMDIGTAKPSAGVRQRVRHHLIDIVTPDINFTAADFRREARNAVADIHGRGLIPIVVGGTGLYLRALAGGLVDAPSADPGYRRELEVIAERQGGDALLELLAVVDPVTAARLHPNDLVRIIRALEVHRQTGCPISEMRREHRFSSDEYDCLKIGIRVDRSKLYQRINERVDLMMQAGFLDEVLRLHAAGFHSGFKAMNSIGYKEISAFIAGEIPLDEALRLIKRNTRHYAKRQETWFARDSEISWVEYPKSFASIVDNVIAFFD